MIVPPLIRPATTSAAPAHRTRVIAPKMRKMTIAVIIARTRMRRLAAAKVASTASLNRAASRTSWVNAWTTLIAPSTSADDRADPRDAVLARPRQRPHAPPEEDDRREDGGNDEEHQPGQLGAEDEHVGDAADAHERVPQRDRRRRRHHLLDHSGVRGQPAGDLRRPVVLEEGGVERTADGAGRSCAGRRRRARRSS